jgi:large subunit ribosomal protein L6e
MPKSRNPELVKGVNRFGRYRSFQKAKRYLVKNRKANIEPKKDTSKIVKQFRGKDREVVRPRVSRYYDTENTPRRLYTRKNRHRAPKIRLSLQPGTVAILLSGKFRGRRVVVLARLPSGLLLVTGPYKVNGVPLKRVNPAFVIATSTHFDITSVAVDTTEKFNDAYFQRPKKKRESKNAQPEQRFESQEKKEDEVKKVIDPARINDQESVDSQLLKLIDEVPQLKADLKVILFSFGKYLI